MEKWKTIKVDQKIKPIHYRARKPIELITGNAYYVSFGNNKVNHCTLIEINEKENIIIIEIPIKPQSKKGYMDNNGNISHHWVDIYFLFPDEIGRTPEEAVMHQVIG